MPAAAASVRMGLVASSSVSKTPNSAFSRSMTPRRSRMGVTLTCTGFHGQDDLLGFSARAFVVEIDTAVDALVAPFFCSVGRAPTRPSAHHWNWYGSSRASSWASLSATGSPATSYVFSLPARRVSVAEAALNEVDRQVRDVDANPVGVRRWAAAIAVPQPQSSF